MYARKAREKRGAGQSGRCDAFVKKINDKVFINHIVGFLMVKKHTKIVAKYMRILLYTDSLAPTV
ncbi:hypothetical protein, partial [Serratia fonticola]|uniref:hypothetical protein n=1 Tax=Serratia fonticola TaxID=47917 RepID=UPI001F1BA2A5